ncbi:MAG: PAS domain S-box protein [Elusimicrobia bacterium]|nr:PAS domain S-box protein [Elusimicrobiota bacterium]
MLNAIKSPSQFEPVFQKAQDYVAEYFGDMNMSPSKGTIEISGERYILVRAAAMSTDFFDIFRRLYSDEGADEGFRIAKQLLFDIAHSIGIQDAKNFHARMRLTDPVEKLSAGPIHFAYSGWAFVDISPDSRPSPDNDYFLLYDHPRSFEADSWIRSGRKSRGTACVMNAGYSSGWCEASFGIPLVATEITCRARGDDACRFIMAPPSRLEGHIQDYLTRAGNGRGRPTSYEIPAFLRGKEIEKARRRALQLSEERFRGLVETTGDWMWELDADGVFTYSSPQVTKILGYTPQEVLGKKFSSFMDPENSSRCSALLQETAAFEKPFSDAEFVCLHRSGYRIAMETSGVPGVAATGERCICRGTSHDITRRKDAERRLAESEGQLRQAQKMDAVGRLAGGIAHDFNNLLMAMEGYAGLLLRSMPRTDERRGDLEEIMKSAERAASLTHQLLAFSRRQILVPRRLNLNTVVRNMENMLRRLISEKIDIEFHLEPSLKPVKADPGQLEQIILNLVINSRDAVSGSGKIIVATRNVPVRTPLQKAQDTIPPGDYAEFTVRDTGTGMDAGVLSHLFEPFFTTKPRGKGTGLGLSMVYGIVKQSNGYIFVESNPGQGTDVRIFFPLDGESAGGAEDFPSVPEKGTGGTETILITEDEPQVRCVAARFLRESGYTVLEAGNGEEALGLLAAPGRPSVQLVLTDLIMPKMDGARLAQALEEKYPEIKVVFMSGYSDDAVLQEAGFKAGTPFLQKPVTENDLLRQVRRTLDGDATDSR